MGSAYAEFAEIARAGSSEGKLADLVVLSRDLFAIPPREILDTRPVLTMVGGAWCSMRRLERGMPEVAPGRDTDAACVI